MKKALRVFLITAGVSAISSVGFAAPAKTTPSRSAERSDATATAFMKKVYSTYLSSNPKVSLSAYRIQNIVIVRFAGGSACTGNKCLVSVVADNSGHYSEIMTLRAKDISVDKSGGLYPDLMIDGVGFDYTGSAEGYVADIKTAGKAFVPRLVPRGQTLKGLETALWQAGWPKTVPFMIKVLTFTDAPETLAIVPNMTQKASLGYCAKDHCPEAIVPFVDGAFKVDQITSGSGLMAILKMKFHGVHEIGVANPRGYEAYGWDAHGQKWLPAFTTYKSRVSPVPQA